MRMATNQLFYQIGDDGGEIKTLLFRSQLGIKNHLEQEIP